ncbi:MAG: M48 family metallopeptidase [Alphaproteobacteria bacterium]|nr:M48 family metallopeptidase [Alphaproteobacteria bacterium]
MIGFVRWVAVLAISVRLLGGVGEAGAGDAPSMIRDAEIEAVLRAYATPLFQAAGIAPDSVKIHIVNDRSLNAFVANGLHLFVHSGLLTRAENAGQVIGVLAHETGHIAGGHLVSLRDEISAAQTQSMIAALLGAATGIAAKRGDVGAAVTMGAQEMIKRNFFSYSRGHEQAADQAAMRFLDATGQSPKGMVDFFDILGDQEALLNGGKDPYTRTHPLTRDRIEFAHHQLQVSRHADAPTRPEFEEMNRRMRAKLFAFMEPPVRTLSRYKEGDASVEARYARAIAFYKKADLKNALPLIDGLIAASPQDPYFVELKGQMLFENARLKEAAEAYRVATALLPGNSLVETSLAQVLIELDDPALLPEANRHLKLALTHEPDNAFAWRLMSIGHGRSGDMGMASYAMGEHALLAGKPEEALYHAERALKLLPKTSPVLLRARDIKDAAEDMRKKSKG